MRRLTIMVIPSGAKATRQFHVPWVLPGVIAAIGAVAFGLFGFFLFDYMNLRKIRAAYQHVALENEGLKGEARVLSSNLEEVKRSLRRVQDYTSKLGEITSLKVQTVSKKTGIGPLSPEEMRVASTQMAPEPVTNYMPLGLNLDRLTFRTVFDSMTRIGEKANQQAVELQQLLSSLSMQKSLLSSVPSISPVNGWVTSGFGERISPFTGERSHHKGIDVASPIGTPIVAPADGVVIFAGFKEGFGNLVMVAHGYGIVTSYGHNSENMVQPGQRLRRGEQIGTVGMTGRTTGPHLHYEIWVNGRVQNPSKFILEDISIR